ncbi:hypothetical protein SUDANB176_00373 [Streptomyces sp. enrichment culture]|uniref:hypothetical protein n=1 Tax=Streptomyces sp. enrichment culture TaxID=1795815 RepID=UPI003F544A96
MHSNDDRDRTTGGLSTENIAQPSGAATGTPGETEEAFSGTPMYPGEGTATTETRSAADEPAAGTATTDAEGTPGPSGTPGASDDEAPQLLTEDEGRGFRERWQEIQSKFVDDPREAVHDADALVADVMQTLASTFAQHKKDLEGQWGQGEQVDTEELRGALRRYRSFFNRLLST